MTRTRTPVPTAEEVAASNARVAAAHAADMETLSAHIETSKELSAALAENIPLLYQAQPLDDLLKRTLAEIIPSRPWTVARLAKHTHRQPWEIAEALTRLNLDLP